MLIVDWDVHHGNGTQDIFYSDGTVAYFSTHQWPLYPGTGKWTESGAGAGSGWTCNVPLPPGTGDAGYQAAFEEVLVPFARRFQPDLILVSAGYDAHYARPAGANGGEHRRLRRADGHRQPIWPPNSVRGPPGFRA